LATDERGSRFTWPEWDLLNGQHHLLAEATNLAREHSDPDRSLVYPLLDAASESTTTLRRLIRALRVSDGYVIARVVYETCVNASFILTDPHTLARRAQRHAKQKALRDLERSIELAGRKVVSLRWEGSDEMLADPESQELLREFTSRSGREITAWTPENVRQRLEVIQRHFGEDTVRGLAFGLLLYRHASEIAHGTLYGALFSWGAMEPGGPPRSTEQMRSFRVEQTRLLLLLIGHTLESMNRILGQELGDPTLSMRATEVLSAYSARPRPRPEGHKTAGWRES